VDETAITGTTVSVKYIGKLENGKVFDSSLVAPFAFKLGAGEVIAGWDQGVAGMRTGEKRRLIIPGDLAYGRRGSPPDIGPNATLIFDVELVHVKRRGVIKYNKKDKSYQMQKMR